jgi:hypothetical protein
MIIVALVVTIRTYFRNRNTRRKGEILIDQLKSHQLNIIDFVKEYQFKVNSLKFDSEADVKEERKLESEFSTIEKLGKFEVMHFQKVRKGEFLFVTRSYINDFVVIGSKTPKDIKHFDTYIFLLRIKPEGYDVCSDIPESNESKFVRIDFSKLLFARIKTII